MKLLKLALISIICIFLLFTGISLFIPSKLRLSKAMDVYSSKGSVMKLIKNPENWKLWYPGADSLPILYIYGKASGIILNDQSKEALNIIEINDSLVTATNIGPGTKRQLVTGWKLIHPENAEWVTVQWYMNFKLKWYPWEKFSSLFYENIYGVEMEKGLSKLKQIAEQDHSSIN